MGNCPASSGRTLTASIPRPVGRSRKWPMAVSRTWNWPSPPRDALLKVPGAVFQAFDGKRFLLRLADLVEAHFEQLALLDTLDMGGPITATRARKQRAIALLRYYAGFATAITATRSPTRRREMSCPTR